MRKKTFVTLEKFGRDLDKIPGMREIVEEERASLHAAQFVQETRKAANLSQAKLAERLGVTQARISQMEKGETPYGPSIALLERVAQACGGVLQLSFQKNG